MLLVDTIPEGELLVTLDYQILTLAPNGYCRRLERRSFDIAARDENFEGIKLLEFFTRRLENWIGPKQWFTLEFFIVDERGPVICQPKPETVKLLLESFMIILCKFCKSPNRVEVIQSTEEFIPSRTRTNTVAVYSFDETQMNGSRGILDTLRKQRGLQPAKVIDNFQKANIRDNKVNLVVIGITKSRKSGAANDIIQIVDSTAPDAVFFEERAISHTNRVHCFEKKNVRVWDTPGVDDQVGRDQNFRRMICSLMDSLPQLNAIYLCIKDPSDMKPISIEPVKEVITYLPRSVRNRVRITITNRNKIREEDRTAVLLQAHRVGSASDVKVCQGTRGAEDYSLDEQVREDIDLPPVRAGYLTRMIELLGDVEVLNTDSLICREVETSMRRLEERIKLFSSLNSTDGVAFTRGLTKIELKSYSRAVSKSGKAPRGAAVELVVFLIMLEQISSLKEMVKCFLSGIGNYEELKQFLVKKEMVLLDQIEDAGHYQNAFNVAKEYVMVLVPIREVVAKNLLNDVKEAVNYFNVHDDGSIMTTGR